jgi:hypothetical protein
LRLLAVRLLHGGPGGRFVHHVADPARVHHVDGVIVNARIEVALEERFCTSSRP